VRQVLFIYLVLLMCPIRFWPLDKDIDNTWVFAINRAAARGLTFGRDLIFTVGPLGYLAVPQDIGRNLATALACQTVAWVVVILVLWKVILRAEIPVVNLVFFSVCLGLSGPLFWFNRMGPENIVLATALILLVRARFHGGTTVPALILIAALPLIKFTAGAIAGGALAGYLVDRVIRFRGKAWREVILAAAVSGGGAALLGCLTFPSWETFRSFLKGSSEISGGYSVAMSLAGGWAPMAGGLLLLVLVVVLLFLDNGDRRQHVMFFGLFLAIPVLISAEHGFIRQDIHVLNYFGFLALSMGLIFLVGSYRGARALYASGVVLLTLAIWMAFAATQGMAAVLADAGGLRTVPLVRLIVSGEARGALQQRSLDNCTAELRLEPEIRAIIQDAPVASTAIVYSCLDLEGLNLRLFPVPQRYSAYTPYLDDLDAAWVRTQGPQFLIADRSEIDGRQPWTDGPATWLEIYRWYDTRLLGTRSFLLQRRPAPRFTHLESLRKWRAPLSAGLDIPPSAGPLFWKATCKLNSKGWFAKLLFGVPESTVKIAGSHDCRANVRIVPQLLVAPSMGSYLPCNLADMATVFAPESAPGFAVTKITFGGPGEAFYQELCDFELLGPRSEPQR
jgi:hypothetical protein